MKKYSCVFTLLLMISACLPQETPTYKLKLIIDADTANEVDDLFALARALCEPSFDLLGITSAQFHISPLATDSSVWESQQINEELVALMNREDVPTVLGSNQPINSVGEPIISPASDFIVQQASALSDGDILHIAILGSCTNVASAILLEPSIISKIKVHYIGFWHDTLSNVYNKKEFNSGNDTMAVNVLLNTRELDFNVMTATTCQQLIFEKDKTFQELNKIGALGEYLQSRWKTYHRWWTREDPEKRSWIMWDVAIIEALAHPRFANHRVFTAPPENTQRPIGIYTRIEVSDMINDFWKALANPQE